MITRPLQSLTALALLMAAPIGAAISQSPLPAALRVPHTLTVRADNDAFDFWRAPWNRPDEEYTSGVHVTYDGLDAPWWAFASLGGGGRCGVRVARCRSGKFEIGQDIYTPAVSVDSGHAAPNARPSGGWLYLMQSVRALDSSSATELAISIGVTGNPSLARFTQRIAHQAAPEFNRPTDWSRAIDFEPGALVKMAHQRRFAIAPTSPIGIDLVPRVSGTVGNIRTELETGFQLRAGWRLAHPWLPSGGGPELTLFAGSSARAVARDLFLDGNTFGSSPHVGHEPLVGASEAGLSVRAGMFEASYRAVSETRSWRGGPKWHPWGSLVGSVTFDR